jgi:hypothetical protein
MGNLMVVEKKGRINVLDIAPYGTKKIVIPV